MSKQLQTYEVTAPDGTVLEVTGPVGASNEEVVRQAQALYKPKAPPPGAPPALTGYDAQQRDLTPGGMAKQQTREFAIGALEPFTIPNVAAGVGNMGKALFDAVMGRGTKRGQEIVKGMVKAPIAPVVGLAEAYEEGDWAKAANSAGGITSQTLPVVAGAGGAVNAARAAAARQAPKIYQKALQPSPRTYSAKEIDAMAKTGLDNGLPVTRSGLNNLDGLVNKLNTAIEADIAANPSAPLSPTKIVSRLDKAKNKAREQVNPDSDLGAISKAEAEFLRQHQTPGLPLAGIPAKDIPIAAARGQIIKKGTYQQLNSKQYGELGSGSVEAQKQLARGIKEELEGYFPEIKAKNAAEGKLFDLRPELEAAVNRVGNRRISLANVINVMADPAVLSRIAIALNKAGVPPAATAIRIRKYSLAISEVNAASAAKK